MRIGIDISQIVYQGTGVANYTRNLVESLLKTDKKNTYVLFFSSLRRKLNCSFINELTINELTPNQNKFGSGQANSRIKVKRFKFPPTLLNFLWKLNQNFPIEWFIGPVDVFLSSDWTQPPTTKAKKVTTVHDLTPWKFPKEMHPKIVATHRRKMKWIKKECDLIIADSKATKKDLVEIIGVPKEKIRVVYLGY